VFALRSELGWFARQRLFSVKPAASFASISASLFGSVRPSASTSSGVDVSIGVALHLLSLTFSIGPSCRRQRHFRFFVMSRRRSYVRTGGVAQLSLLWLTTRKTIAIVTFSVTIADLSSHVNAYVRFAIARKHANAKNKQAFTLLRHPKNILIFANVLVPFFFADSAANGGVRFDRVSEL